MNFIKGKHGPDVSFYQDDDTTPQKIDFQKMKDAGASFVILRGGQNTWVDEDFRDYINAVKTVGLSWGSYWFYDSRNSPENQASIWRAACGSDIPAVIAVDLEESYGGAYSGELNWKRFIISCLGQFPNSRLLIYTANWWWAAQTVYDPAFFGAYPLWVAGYPTSGDPADVILPAPWRGTQAHLWQYTDREDGIKYGVESYRIDMNYWNNFYNFEDFWGSATPPDNGGDMIWKKATGSITMRTSPSKVDGIDNIARIDGKPQYVLNNDILELSEITNGWGHIVNIYRNEIKIAIPPDPVWCGLLYTVDTSWRPPVDPEPPAGDLPVIHYTRTETFRADGYPDKTVTTEFDWTPNA